MLAGLHLPCNLGSLLFLPALLDSLIPFRGQLLSWQLTATKDVMQPLHGMKTQTRVIAWMKCRDQTAAPLKRKMLVQP
jgi:hypothetical protein